MHGLLVRLWYGWFCEVCLGCNALSYRCVSCVASGGEVSSASRESLGQVVGEGSAVAPSESWTSPHLTTRQEIRVQGLDYVQRFRDHIDHAVDAWVYCHDPHRLTSISDNGPHMLDKIACLTDCWSTPHVVLEQLRRLCHMVSAGVSATTTGAWICSTTQ